MYKEEGRSPYHPRVMLKAVLYAYMNNIYSCRKIEKSLVRDIHFIWLTGYACPDFITINRFRNRDYKRFRHFGKDKIMMDFAFFAIAFNLKKMAATMCHDVA